MSFKVIMGRFPSDIEQALNKLAEDWHPVEPMCMDYNPATNQHTVIVRVGQETLPCTTLSQIYQVKPRRLDK